MRALGTSVKDMYYIESVMNSGTTRRTHILQFRLLPHCRDLVAGKQLAFLLRFCSVCSLFIYHLSGMSRRLRGRIHTVHRPGPPNGMYVILHDFSEAACVMDISTGGARPSHHAGRYLQSFGVRLPDVNSFFFLFFSGYGQSTAAEKDRCEFRRRPELRLAMPHSCS
jgi:hypothetical protein